MGGFAPKEKGLRPTDGPWRSTPHRGNVGGNKKTGETLVVANRLCGLLRQLLLEELLGVGDIGHGNKQAGCIGGSGYHGLLLELLLLKLLLLGLLLTRLLELRLWLQV